ncbi:cilia- and flagella-associated protein 157 [Planococcus citri]|uniref:cilia- and flagella-associated protein 157 n=1 Tax=Planococcus citri TaxID=170843 RepID=UPI0031F9F402
MAKKKLKKNSKKKSQKKQKKQQKDEKSELPEVNKELYEIQISDLNAKLQRLKDQCAEYEAENIEVKETLAQLNEDRADVIAYLKRILRSKTDEIFELRERVVALQQARQIENAEFTEKFRSKENELKSVRDQLTSEVNLLNGKLNVLDEFRVQKDELMRKFQQQEEARKEQEVRHQETLHNIEKDFILKKIHLKKEVEERLIKLSEDFQTIMQLKIGSTTKITVAENNALKKEMNKLMEVCKDLIKENNEFKNKEQMAKIKYSLLKEEANESLNKYLTTNKNLQAVLLENQSLKCQLETTRNQYDNDVTQLSNNLEECRDNLNNQLIMNKETQEELQQYKIQDEMQRYKLDELAIRMKKLNDINTNAVESIKNVVLENPEHNAKSYYDRISFASSLLEILKTAKMEEDINTFLDKSFRS